MLNQLIYVSNRACTSHDIEKILETAQVYNKRHNLTGLLLYTDTKFVQLIEGEKKDLDTLYDKISKDARHTSPCVISTDIILERAFPSWQMAGKRIGTNKIDYISSISSNEKEKFEETLAGKKDNGFFVTELMKRFFYVLWRARPGRL